MNLISIPAFQDNYIWVLVDDERRCVIVDPGESAPVSDAIKENGWQPEAILLTHHHNDHTGGVADLRAQFPHLVVYGPAETQDKGTTQVVEEGENILIREWEFLYLLHQVTLWDHLCFYNNLIFFAATRCSPEAVEGFLRAPQPDVPVITED